MNRIALALAVAAVSASTAAAQSNRKTTWDDLLKPVEAKTNPAIPVAPSRPAEPARPLVPVSRAMIDSCVVNAVARLPTAITPHISNSTTELFKAEGFLESWWVIISVDVLGRKASYQRMCLIDRRDGSVTMTQ